MTKRIELSSDIPDDHQIYVNYRATENDIDLKSWRAIAEDLEENCEGQFWIGAWQAWFEKQSDATYFALKYTSNG